MFFTLQKKIDPYISRYPEYRKAIRLFEVVMCLWIIFHCYRLIGVSSLINTAWNFCPNVESRHFFNLDTMLWRAGGLALFVPGVLCQALVAGWVLLKGSSWLSRTLFWLVVMATT